MAKFLGSVYRGRWFLWHSWYIQIFLSALVIGRRGQAVHPGFILNQSTLSVCPSNTDWSIGRKVRTNYIYSHTNTIEYACDEQMFGIEFVETWWLTITCAFSWSPWYLWNSIWCHPYTPDFVSFTPGCETRVVKGRGNPWKWPFIPVKISGKGNFEAWEITSL